MCIRDSTNAQLPNIPRSKHNKNKDFFMIKTELDNLLFIKHSDSESDLEPDFERSFLIEARTHEQHLSIYPDNTKQWGLSNRQDAPRNLSLIHI